MFHHKYIIGLLQTTEYARTKALGMSRTADVRAVDCRPIFAWFIATMWHYVFGMRSHSGYGIYHVTAFRMNSPAPIRYGSVFIAISFFFYSFIVLISLTTAGGVTLIGRYKHTNINLTTEIGSD